MQPGALRLHRRLAAVQAARLLGRVPGGSEDEHPCLIGPTRSGYTGDEEKSRGSQERPGHAEPPRRHGSCVRPVRECVSNLRAAAPYERRMRMDEAGRRIRETSGVRLRSVAGFHGDISTLVTSRRSRRAGAGRAVQIDLPRPRRRAEGRAPGPEQGYARYQEIRAADDVYAKDGAETTAGAVAWPA